MTPTAGPGRARWSSWHGFAQFQDYGPGAPGGGNNDDYIIVGDTCADGVGVKAWAWLDGVLLGSKYNGSGSGHDDILPTPGSRSPQRTIRNRHILPGRRSPSG
jgi:hypothetical protein